MSPIEIWAITLGVVYILLAIKNHASCFIFGLVSCLLWAYASYFNYNLQWDAVLNLFYAGMSIYGIYIWTKGNNGFEMPVRRLTKNQNIFAIFVGGICIICMTWLGESILQTSFAFLDSLTTVLSIIGTIYIAKRYIGSWIYLLIADLIYIYIYHVKEATLFMWMMIFYSIMAFVGFLQWRKILNQQK